MQLKDACILIIDDDTDVLTAVRLLLKTEVKEVLVEKNPENIYTLLSRHSIDVILLDMNYKSAINTGNEGFYWLKEIKKKQPAIPVIMITAYGDIDLAVRSLKEGAVDFVVKPWHNERLIETLKTTLKEKEKNNASSSWKDSNTIEGLIGKSPVMQDVFLKIKKLAPTDANILILGENGTGKDGIAKAIHQFSARSKKAFIKVDVGALTESLFESELFGYKKGAFTDAREDRAGRFEAAHEGTLFLDEIGNISLQQQAKLLTVLQNRQVTKLGTNEAKPVDIRLVCATNISFQQLADETRFRKDLIYRINTVEITIPPLRQRGDDIILLAEYFADIYARKYSKGAIQIDNKAKQKLAGYHFPGNVRELQYAIERAIIMAESDTLTESDIIFSALENKETAAVNDTNLTLMEKNTIQRVVEKHNGNITRAARELGLTRTALYRRLS
ncbi:MAG: sigma-54-dependent Fis family transcriptional regulator, partial [Sphingobacteriales bacterium]